MKPKPYRRILTSSLHRKFVHASALSLLTCYIISFFIGPKDSFFWSWFPLGPCGIRAVMLFISSLVIFILRVGQMHVGSRTANSAFSRLRGSILSLSSVKILGWYTFSAWIFGEVYIWSSPAQAGFNWVKPGRPSERAQLNERPIYLHCYYFMLAVIQCVLHIYFEWDQVPIPITQLELKSVNSQSNVALSMYLIGMESIFVTFCGPIIYTLVLRQRAWSLSLYFAKLFWSFPRSAAQPPGIIPALHISLLFRAAFSGMFLLILWQASNVLFTTFIGQSPLKKGQPLTNDSKYPNGSLIDGLYAKKGIVRSFAFWELNLISQKFPECRKRIFDDIDQEGGSAWSQILLASAELITGVSNRTPELQEAQSPRISGKELGNKNDQYLNSQPLPQIASPPQSQNIFQPSSRPLTRHQKLESILGAVAKSYGQSPDWTPVARKKTHDMLARATSVVFSPEQKQKILSSTGGLRMLAKPHRSDRSIHPFLRKLICLPIGYPFRQSYRKRLRTVILSTPYSNTVSISLAVESISNLLIASLAEDKYGKVQGDISFIIRLFSETATRITVFSKAGGLGIHWTDVDFPDASSGDKVLEAQHDEEVEAVLRVLKKALARLLAAFEPYLSQIGLSKQDLRLAKDASLSDNSPNQS